MNILKIYFLKNNSIIEYIYCYYFYYIQLNFKNIDVFLFICLLIIYK